ncbi:hypothetical protein [Streptacidiphilus fuscans]|uniref:Uncharacterized protein n=1 Tax=Streptacidiphilus fuscans TaxID=2789292 RepID=A0A931FI40_9ACTN|nr:hypothetical protein [Streptacidiphilus fuscans]MBF9072501.1 hypothetical protein [Streptacidiphilus fuscans]
MSGLVELLPGLRLDPVSGPRPHTLATDPADELAERFGEIAATAVHPLEVVAAIEADGLTDSQIQQRYGRRDAFELGEELFSRAHGEAGDAGADAAVPNTRNAANAASATDAARAAKVSKNLPSRFRSVGASAWDVSAPRCALRGVLFALPGLAYLLYRPPHGLDGSIGAALLLSWGWSQAVAHLAYLRRGQEDQVGAAAFLLLGGAAGVVLAPLAASVMPGATAPTVAYAAGQALYFAAATALLVLGRERLLLRALTPVVLGAVWVVVSRRLGGAPPRWAGAGLILLALALALTAGWQETVPTLRSGRADHARVRVSRSEWWQAAGAGVFGLGVAVLTLAQIGSTTLALTLSMGGAEWFLARCRATTELALSRTGSKRRFHRLVLSALVRCLCGYLVLVAALVAATALLWPEAGGPGLVALAALAAAIWSAQLLQSLGLLGRATIAVATAGAAVVVARAAGVPAGAAQSTVSAVAALVLLLATAQAVGTATRHR